MITRRDFIKQTTILAGAALLPAFASGMEIGKKAIGLQLFSLRDVIGNDIAGIIAKVAAMGYKEVETYGFSAEGGFWGLKPKDFASLLKQHELTSPSGHFNIDDFLLGKGRKNLDSCIEAANILDSKYITIPFSREDLRKTADDYKKLSHKFNEAAIVCQSAGLKLAYHNHDFEFVKFNGITGYEIMLAETDKKLVDFEMDLYWVSRAGLDPIALFKAHPKRFTMWHVKDMDKRNKNLNSEIGKGAVDFKAIFAKAKLAGVKHYFVEHESNYKPDELGSVKASFDYVNNELL